MNLGEFQAALPKGDLWVFGYGSLMWSPCFDFTQRALGRAHGYHRALCILSTRYRGTEAKPGLVMGLCRGGSCWGVAYRIHAQRLRRALARLWYREMPRRVYQPTLIPVRLASGRKVKALIYNTQVTDAMTDQLLAAAREANVPVVGVTETVPEGMSYAEWMTGQLESLERALSGPSS